MPAWRSSAAPTPPTRDREPSTSRRRIFPRVSFDLIYALPGETEAGWSSTLDRALAKGTSHLSLYQLTIEPGHALRVDGREA